MKEKAQLFLIPTPIGNLEDITLRALRLMKEVDLILAEDTRITSRLLKNYKIDNKLKSYHAYNEHRIQEHIINELKSGLKIALVTDAGTPGISDPGYLIVKACIENDIDVECLPGPTAFIPALIKSGIPSDRFVFEGFLPHKKGRKKRLDSLVSETRTMVFYESPHRLIRTLNDLQNVFGSSRPASLSRELTKKYEQTITGDLESIHLHYADKKIKGEFVIIVQGIS
jgi:16S rRNA (cytidine1402-2'-O)-methyltransferase